MRRLRSLGSVRRVETFLDPAHYSSSLTLFHTRIIVPLPLSEEQFTVSTPIALVTTRCLAAHQIFRTQSLFPHSVTYYVRGSSGLQCSGVCSGCKNAARFSFHPRSCLLFLPVARKTTTVLDISQSKQDIYAIPHLSPSFSQGCSSSTCATQ